MDMDDDRPISASERERAGKQVAKQIWDIEYRDLKRSDIRSDDWLDLFKETIIDKCETPIIDLGCGKGQDTLYLVERGKIVIPCDYSISAIESIRRNFPEIERAECFDMAMTTRMGQPYPFRDNFTDLIICGLSLHYFTEKTTFEILEEIKRVLKPGGILLFRVNSINDTNFGANAGKEVERTTFTFI